MKFNLTRHRYHPSHPTPRVGIDDTSDCCLRCLTIPYIPYVGAHSVLMLNPAAQLPRHPKNASGPAICCTARTRFGRLLKQRKSKPKRAKESATPSGKAREEREQARYRPPSPEYRDLCPVDPLPEQVCGGGRAQITGE